MSRPPPSCDAEVNNPLSPTDSPEDNKLLMVPGYLSMNEASPSQPTSEMGGLLVSSSSSILVLLGLFLVFLVAALLIIIIILIIDVYWYRSLLFHSSSFNGIYDALPCLLDSLLLLTSCLLT
jgi:hypothetical protein